MSTPIAPVLAAVAALVVCPSAVIAAERPAAAPTAPAVPAAAPTLTDVVSHAIGLSPAHVRTYWTRARMRNATTVDMLAPAKGHPRAMTAGATDTGSVWQGTGAVSASSGKVFFTLAGRDYVCSASTVQSRSGDLVITAGHCAKNGAGAWATNWVFVPGYVNGTSPHGQFPARRMFVTKGWADDADENEDVAMVAVGTDKGRHVDDAVGAQKIAFGGPRGREVYSFGYPAEPPYGGGQLIACSGDEHADTEGGSTDEGLDCDMTEGSSGGPWLARFNPATGRGVITSVNAFKYSDDPNTMYGPYFGPKIRALYARATGG